MAMAASGGRSDAKGDGVEALWAGRHRPGHLNLKQDDYFVWLMKNLNTEMYRELEDVLHESTF